MTSFRKFLTENSSLNSKNYNYSCYDSYLDEELKNDEQAIKQLQDREFEIQKRIRSSQEKLQKLQNKSSSLQKRISKMFVDILNGKVSRSAEVTIQFEENKKELEKTDKEIESVFDKINSYYDEIDKINSAVQKMLIKNIKKS